MSIIAETAVGRKVFVIAELGINHGGDMMRAIEMILKSKTAGADMAKFQTYDPHKILGNSSPFLREASDAQFSLEEHKYLKEVCERNGIEWGISLFHGEDVEWAERVGLKRYKIASRAALDPHLLREINRTEKPVILSTGLLTTGAEIDKTLTALRDCDVSLLYCRCEYPTKPEHVDLGEMNRLGRHVRKVGISSHCPSPIPTMAAVARGALFTENHVTFSRERPGCDMASSLTFDEFGEMVKAIRIMERMP